MTDEQKKVFDAVMQQARLLQSEGRASWHTYTQLKKKLASVCIFDKERELAETLGL